MSYSTATSILVILPGLPQTTTVTPAYTNTIAIISRHITRADNIINGKIAARYKITDLLTSVPPLLQTIAEDITAYYTYRSLFSGDNQNANEWTDKFMEAMKTLDEIHKGDIDLVDSTGALIEEWQSSTSTFVDSTTKDYQSVFDMDETLDWDVNQSLKDEISGRR